jgi:hypothetical protein
MAKTSISLADLDAVKASETPFTFEYVKPNGDASGIMLQVLGGNSDAVRTVAAEMINARRSREATKEMQRQRSGRNGAGKVDFDPVESDIAFGQRLAAVRLVGWEGIQEPWTPENAATLCRSNSHLAAQVMEQSDDLANFMKD